VTSSNLLFWIPLFPLLGTFVLGGIALWSAHRNTQPSEKTVGILAVAFPALAFLMTTGLALSMPIGSGLRQILFPWISSDMLHVNFGFLFDDLSRIMLLFITGIGSLITLYSTGYMHGDRGFARFMAYLNLFLFSMITLVLADNLVLTFLGWEGVGLCSYLLIGFWHHDSANGAAANKAFLVNRAGDLGFLLGIFALITLAGSSGISYVELKAWLASVRLEDLLQGHNHVLIVLATFFLFWGATAKSAQIPLLTWLPDAMAGPTPVSALIHAATMVTSGVYLVARLSDLFVLSHFVMNMIAVIGLATAVWAAVTGLLQNDIKKVLAYSTVSQLGFMFLAAGCGAFDAAIFHVFTHAFFKATLFLGAGSVIHALSGEQDLRRMGGLTRKLPRTFLFLVLGWVSIIGIPGTAGFWSKDLLLERVYSSGPNGHLLYYIALATAVLTALYMTRMMVLAFAGKYRGDHHVLDHAHESPLSMSIPMAILAAGSVLVGFFWAGMIPGLDLFGRALAPITAHAQEVFLSSEQEGPAAWVFGLVGTCAALIGAGAGFGIFRKFIPAASASSAPVGWARRWTLLFDSVHALVIKPTQGLAWLLQVIVQPLFEGMNWVAGLFAFDSSAVIRKIQAPGIRLQLGFALGSGLVLSVLIFRGII